MNKLFKALGFHTSQTSATTGGNLALSEAAKKKRFLEYVAKATSRVRMDIKSWKDALQAAQSDDPKNFQLQLLYDEIMIDALLTSQIQNRTEQVFSCEYVLKNAAGVIDEEQTSALQKMPAFRSLTGAVLASNYFGYSLIELGLEKNDAGEIVVGVELIPRANVVPQKGLFFPDYTEDKSIAYREMAEYKTWILEFNTGNFGLLNKAVVHVLFKRFAQSCWSELCEIYGIPPRVLKTNTQDSVMLSRAQKMMADMGSAAWFIIDETESFEWAQGTSTNGEVYDKLITRCSNELSLLISGAIIGQDTVNGNRSKEESSQEMLWQLVQSDMAMLEEVWNNTIIPAFVKLGVLKAGNRFEYKPTEDIEQLWKFTIESLPYFTIEPTWIKETFGIEITGERKNIAGAAPGTDGPGKEKQKNSLSDFFD